MAPQAHPRTTGWAPNAKVLLISWRATRTTVPATTSTTKTKTETNQVLPAGGKKSSLTGMLTPYHYQSDEYTLIQQGIQDMASYCR